MKNAPLKGARAIGSNMTEVEHGDLTILYSYKTPVAFLSPNGGYRTEQKWSATTSKHISKFFSLHGYDFKGAFKLPQDDLERFVGAGKVPSEGRISGYPRENRPRRTARRRGLIRDMQFFREQAGYVVGERSKGALDLARAEREMKRRGWVVTWQPDNDADLSWMSDEERAQDHEIYGAILWDRDPVNMLARTPRERKAQQLASLWGIVDPSSEYQRVVEAELASEALSRA